MSDKTIDKVLGAPFKTPAQELIDTGQVVVSDDDDIEKANELILEPGQNFHVYRGLRHRMIALEDSELFEFSTEHFDSDSYRVIKGD